MTQHQSFALSRYTDVRAALTNWEVFSSARGVSMNDDVNAAIAGNTLGSDPPLHTPMRALLCRALSPAKLRELQQPLQADANRVVDRLVQQGFFDVATELAPPPPACSASNSAPSSAQ